LEIVNQQLNLDDNENELRFSAIRSAFNGDKVQKGI